MTECTVLKLEVVVMRSTSALPVFTAVTLSLHLEGIAKAPSSTQSSELLHELTFN